MTSRSALIDEVFIKPIRTVMVVDDEFPTLDDFLAIEQALDKKKSRNMQRVQDILAFCRDESRGWLVDIHDGKSNKEGIAVAGHLHHSDLLILDYHLEWPSDSGEKAIGILRELAKSAHFNLVIVYTAADINRTVGEIALGLTCEDAKLEWSLPGAKSVEDALDEWSDKAPDTNIRNQLIGALDPQTFLRIRWDEKRNLKIELDRSDLASFKAIAESAEGVGIKVAPSAVLKWCLSKVQQNLAGSLSPEDLGKVAVSIDAGTNWIRTGGLFVTVVSKTQPTAELPSRLSTALRSWDPLPQRLILSKLQTELDAVGTNAENEILSNKHLQAGWLDDFLNENGQAIPTSTTIERHWESLGDAIRPEVMNYSAQLAKSLLDIGDIRRYRFEGEASLDYEREKGDISFESNIHACSKRISGSHLAVGHVLMTQRNGQNRYWICLTPACDLVPGQKESGWMARLGTWMPFKAVQLFPQNPDDALVEATRGNHLFLRIDGSPQAFGFLPPTLATSNPKWEQMFARNNGRFDDSDRFLTIADLSAADNGELAANSTEGQVVAQLRYEYALNLLQRLGANLSRIGLDFQSHGTASQANN